MNLSSEIQNWYRQYKRALPWRDTKDAYVIWLSEIILQQTRVEQGLPYFNRFLARFPDVSAFAAATEDEVLKLWQGLGYYSRGRNMLVTARQVLADHQAFPVKYEELIKLKGIGEYTAAAIASFAADEPKAVVDGNVYRVLARFFGVDEAINSPKGKRTFQLLADEVLDRQHPGNHNQAMMEFGAMLCKPKNPDCNICPVREGCNAYATGRIAILPVKLKTVKIRARYFTYFVVWADDQLLLHKRSINDIWANMYDFPLIENPAFASPQEIMATFDFKDFFGDDAQIRSVSTIKKHILTHQHIFAQFITLNINPKQLKLQSDWFFATLEEAENLAMPKIIHQHLLQISQKEALQTELNLN